MCYIQYRNATCTLYSAVPLYMYLQIVTTLGIIGSLATAMGSACSKFSRAFIPGTFGVLADSKVCVCVCVYMCVGKDIQESDGGC